MKHTIWISIVTPALLFFISCQETYRQKGGYIPSEKISFDSLLNRVRSHNLILINQESIFFMFRNRVRSDNVILIGGGTDDLILYVPNMDISDTFICGDSAQAIKHLIEGLSYAQKSWIKCHEDSKIRDTVYLSKPNRKRSVRNRRH